MEDREKRTYEFLDKLGIGYELYRHKAVMTIEDASEIDKKIGLHISKNLFLSTRHSTEFFLLFMQGNKKFNTGKVSKQIGVPRMTFASNDFMLEYLDILPGSVSPLGLMNDKENHVKFLIDSDIIKEEKVAMHPCVNTATLVMALSDLADKVLPACGHSVTVVEV